MLVLQNARIVVRVSESMLDECLLNKEADFFIVRLNVHINLKFFEMHRRRQVIYFYVLVKIQAS